MNTYNHCSAKELKDKKEITKIFKDIWLNICILERDYGVEWDSYMTNILKFTIQCIANKYDIKLGLRDEKTN